jgi:hypothetical protein
MDMRYNTGILTGGCAVMLGVSATAGDVWTAVFCGVAMLCLNVFYAYQVAGERRAPASGGNAIAGWWAWQDWLLNMLGVALAIALILFAVMVSPAIWSRTAVWRVHHVPALTSKSERDGVALADEIQELGEQIRNSLAQNVSNASTSQDGIASKLLADEVSKREHAMVLHARVTAVEGRGQNQGVVEFDGGVADVSFAFIDPILTCPAGEESVCEKKAKDNPLGFTVISYTAHYTKAG